MKDGKPGRKRQNTIHGCIAGKGVGVQSFFHRPNVPPKGDYSEHGDASQYETRHMSANQRVTGATGSAVWIAIS